MIEKFIDRNNVEVNIGDACIWEDRVGNIMQGTFQGIKGTSGHQAAFHPNGEEKLKYVEISQLYKANEII